MAITWAKEGPRLRVGQESGYVETAMYCAQELKSMQVYHYLMPSCCGSSRRAQLHLTSPPILLLPLHRPGNLLKLC